MDSEELTLLFADKVGDWRVGDWTGPKKASTMRKKKKGRIRKKQGLKERRLKKK